MHNSLWRNSLSILVPAHRCLRKSYSSFKVHLKDTLLDSSSQVPKLNEMWRLPFEFLHHSVSLLEHSSHSALDFHCLWARAISSRSDYASDVSLIFGILQRPAQCLLGDSSLKCIQSWGVWEKWEPESPFLILLGQSWVFLFFILCLLPTLLSLFYQN